MPDQRVMHALADWVLPGDQGRSHKYSTARPQDHRKPEKHDAVRAMRPRMAASGASARASCMRWRTHSYQKPEKYDAFRAVRPRMAASGASARARFTLWPTMYYFGNHGRLHK